MTYKQTIFFLKTDKIPENSLLFEKLKQEDRSFSYFRVNGNYYLFFYGETLIEIDFLYQSQDLSILEELDVRRRKIRSERGFFLYALEIMEGGNDLEILSTNLKPSFWSKLKSVMRLNNKKVLLEFLFGSDSSKPIDLDIDKKFKALENKIQILESQAASSDKKIKALENNLYQMSMILLKKNRKILSDEPKTAQNEFSEDLGNKIRSSKNDIKKELLEGSSSRTSSKIKKRVGKKQEEPVFGTLRGWGKIQKTRVFTEALKMYKSNEITDLREYFEGSGKECLLWEVGERLNYEAVKKNPLFQKIKAEFEAEGFSEGKRD